MGVSNIVYAFLLFIFVLSIGLLIVPWKFEDARINEIQTKIEEKQTQLQQSLQNIGKSSGLQQLLDWLGLGFQAAVTTLTMFFDTIYWFNTIIAVGVESLGIPSAIAKVIAWIVPTAIIFMIGFVILRGILKWPV